MSKNALLALAGGAASGMFSFVLPFASPLPLFLVGFGLGLSLAIMAAAAALVTSVLIGAWPGLIICALTVVAPVLVLVRHALLARPDEQEQLEWYPVGMLAVWLAGIGVSLVAIAVALAAGTPEGAQGWIEARLSEMITHFGLADNAEQVAVLVSILAPTAPGLAVASWMILLVVNGSLAQNLLVASKRSIRPATALAMFQLPNWMPAGAAAAAVLGFLGSGDLAFLGWNLLVVLLIPFFLTGIAVAHVVSRRWPGRPLVLIMFYVFLVLFSWPVSLLLTMLGVLEQWLDLRGRAVGATGSGSGGTGPGQT